MPDNDSQTALRGRPKDPAKREAILDAAKALFIAQGFAGTSMDAVATEAGVSKLTVYSHFSDKATLFAAAVEAKCEGMMPFPIFSLEADDNLTVVLERIGHAFVTLINSEEAIALERLMASLAGQDTEMARLFSRRDRSAPSTKWSACSPGPANAAWSAWTIPPPPPNCSSACCRAAATCSW